MLITKGPRIFCYGRSPPPPLPELGQEGKLCSFSVESARIGYYFVSARVVEVATRSFVVESQEGTISRFESYNYCQNDSEITYRNSDLYKITFTYQETR